MKENLTIYLSNVGEVSGNKQVMEQKKGEIRRSLEILGKDWNEEKVCGNERLSDKQAHFVGRFIRSLRDLRSREVHFLRKDFFYFFDKRFGIFQGFFNFIHGGTIQSGVI